MIKYSERYKEQFDIKFLKEQRIYSFNEYYAITDLNSNIQTTNIITTKFSISRNNNEYIGYTYLYSFFDKDELKFAYIDYGLLCESRDGEYRNNFTIYDLFEKAYDQNIGQLTVVEEKIYDEINSGIINLKSDLFVPNEFNNDKLKKLLNNKINQNHIMIKSLVMSHVAYTHLICSNTIYNHVQRLYEKNFIDISKELNLSLTDFNLQNHSKISHILATVGAFVLAFKTRLGQKIVPLLKYETVNIADLSYSAWREYYIGKMAFELTLNHICESFVYVGRWFYINDANVDLYNNSAMFQKYENSDIANDVDNQLISAKSRTFKIENNTPVFRDANFKELYKRIKRSSDYANSTLCLGDKSLCFLMEHTGNTWGDADRILNFINKYASGTELALSEFKKENTLMAFLFSLFNGIYCLNKYLSTCHSDFHINNFCFLSLTGYHNVNDYRNDNNNNYVNMYIVDNITYMLPWISFSPKIIDYSRVIVGNSKFVEERIGVYSHVKFNHSQVERAKNIMRIYMKDIAKAWEKELQIILENNIELFVRAVSPIDLYCICECVIGQLRLESMAPFAPPKEILDKVDAFGKLVLKTAQTNVELLFRGRVQNITEMPWPNPILLAEFYKEYIYDSVKKYDENTYIVNVFNNNDPIKHDIFDKSTWPDEYINPKEEDKVMKIFDKNYDARMEIGEFINEERKKYVD